MDNMWLVWLGNLKLRDTGMLSLNSIQKTVGANHDQYITISIYQYQSADTDQHLR